MVDSTRQDRETCGNVTCDVDFVHEDRIERVRPHVPTRETVEPVAETLAVLGDPTKLRLLVALSHEELCVCDIAYVLDMKRSAISHQLRLLRDRGMVKLRKEGRVAYYSLAGDAVRALVRLACEQGTKCLLET